MPYNGTGTYALIYNWPNDAAQLIKISSARMQAEFDGVATALTTAICRDGQSTISADIPFNSKKITGLGAGSAATDAARLADVQSGQVAWVAAGGTVDAITATYSPAITALTDGLLLAFRASGANTSTTPTFAPNGLTARTVTRLGGQALVAADIAGEHLVRYTLASTRWELLNPSPLSAKSIAGLLDAQQDFRLSGDISPSQITSNQNDYSPTGLSTATVLRLTSDASRNITGIAGGADGRVLVLFNVGSFDIVLKDASGSSTAANRLAFGADLTISASKSVTLQYDSTSSRWRPKAVSGALIAANNLSDVASASTSRTSLGLGTAAVADTGTSGHVVPFLDGANTWAGQTFGNIFVTGILELDGVVSPTQITSDQNNYSPTGWSSGASTLRISTDASRNITGLVPNAGIGGTLAFIMNIGAQSVVLKNENASSSAANRFAIGSDITIAAAGGVTLMYDGTSTRWRCVGKY